MISVSLNVLIDPYETFPNLHIQSIDRSSFLESRISKANKILHGQWNILAVGSSRTLAAFPDSRPTFDNQKYFNAALPATSINEVTAVVDLIFKHNTPKRVIMGLEHDCFSHSTLVGEFHKSSFVKSSKRLDILVEQAISVESLIKSLSALKLYPPAKKPDLSMIEKFKVVLNNSIKVTLTFDPPSQFSDDVWTLYQSFQATAIDNHSEMDIILMPIHATLMMTYDRLGIWPSIENWMRGLVKHKHPNVTIWDFSGIEQRQTEDIPAEQSRDQSMIWFTDPSHISPKYGDLIMNQVMNGQGSEGIILTEKNVEERIKTLRQELDTFYNQHPEQVQFVDTLIKNNKYFVKSMRGN